MLHLIQGEKQRVELLWLGFPHLHGTERKAGGLQEGIGCRLHLGSDKPFRTHPETGSDEISSHMNCHVHPAASCLGEESRAWGSGSRGEGRRGLRQTVGKVPTLPLTGSLILLRLGLSKLVYFHSQ